MREHCTKLNEEVIQSGHWIAQRYPVAVNAALEMAGNQVTQSLDSNFNGRERLHAGLRQPLKQHGEPDQQTTD